MSAGAQEDLVLDRWSFKVGTYFPDTKTRIRVDGPDGSIGTVIQYEEELELRGSDVSIDVGAAWRFAKKHAVEVEYFNISRSGNATLDARIEFGDTVFEELFDVDSYLRTKVMRLGYAYSLLQDPRYSLAIHLGLHITDIETGITASDADGGISKAVGATAPLPVFGLIGAWRFGERWSILGQAQYFHLEVGDYDGKMTQLGAAIEHQTFKSVGFGIGYRDFDIVVNIDGSDLIGNVDFEYTGPIIYVRASF